MLHCLVQSIERTTQLLLYTTRLIGDATLMSGTDSWCSRWMLWHTHAMGVVGCLILTLSGGAAELERHALTIAYTGATDGELAPCGCPGGEQGGFARRAELLEAWGKDAAPLLILDVGNVFQRQGLTSSDGDNLELARASFLVQLMNQVGTQAAAVGPRDLWALGIGDMRKLVVRSSFPWLSANLEDESGKLVFQPSTVLSLGGVRIGLVGLTEPIQAVAARESLQFRPFEAAARLAASRLRGEVDLLIGLSNLSEPQNRMLQSTVPAFDLILAGPPPDRIPLIGSSGPPWVVRVHGEGRFVGRLDVQMVTDASSRLTHSAELERGLDEIAAVERSLEGLKRLIIQEEGLLNEPRYERDGAFLQQRVESLKQRLMGLGMGRSVFAYRQIPLGARLAGDEEMLKQIKSFERKERHNDVDGRGSMRTGAAFPLHSGATKTTQMLPL